MRTLRAEGLVKAYRSRTVVKGVDLEVRQGEIVGLLGPNGAGKTTSFYMIVGLLRADAGDIFIDDRIAITARVPADPSWPSALTVQDGSARFEGLAQRPRLT